MFFSLQKYHLIFFNNKKSKASPPDMEGLVKVPRLAGELHLKMRCYKIKKIIIEEKTEGLKLLISLSNGFSGGEIVVNNSRSLPG